MSKLWQKNNIKLHPAIEKFTVGNDYILDKELVPYDVYGSIAHSQMLKKIGILTGEELTQLKRGLKEILELSHQGRFEIKQEDEDSHTAIENYLTEKLGEVGKKIHTGRSRNDQVLVMLRLYSKEQLLKTEKSLLELAQVLLKLSRKFEQVPMAGYSHMQRAMPSSVGLWCASFVESLLDDLELLKIAYQLNDQSPLGSGAGFGVALPLDRKMVADLLGFSRVQNNVLYCQNSRGKIESIILAALSQVMLDLSKLASDVLLYTTSEFEFFEFPEEFYTGSSIMPQKKNLDVFELIRAKAGLVLGLQTQLLNVIKPLPSGYNRDFQETKQLLIKGFDLTQTSLETGSLVMAGLKIKIKKLEQSCSPEMLAADQALELANEGMPFRDAYAEVSAHLPEKTRVDMVEYIKNKNCLGAPGHLGLDKLKEKIGRESKGVKQLLTSFQNTLDQLAHF